MSVLQALYDSEINFSISTFWDGGFDVKLGEEINGFKAFGNCGSMADAERWLKEKAVELYPESDFAKAQ